MSNLLFPELEPPKPRYDGGGPFARVAIERSLDRVLDYGIPAELVSSVRVGQRVRVPLGRNNKLAHGYVVAIEGATAYKQVKAIHAIDDARVLLPAGLLELARWMSRYYCCPLGTVIESIIPSAVKKKVGLGYTPMVRLAKSREEIQGILEKAKTPKRRAILARLLQMEAGQGVDLVRIAREAGATPMTVRKLVKAGLISITPEPDYDFTGFAEESRAGEAEPEKALNEDQQKAYDELLPRVRDGGFSVNLLYGVTGSGKTEVYLRCIKEVVGRGKRAIVLVPEIALTPQTVARFTARLPRVAVLHSGLVASVRHRFWQQIAQGQAEVVVGARSAIFAPVPDLGIIVIDEEHEGSYKQDTAPRYHGRDIAIKRAQMENVPVVLGSATPALESWQRVIADEKKEAGSRVYHLLSLPRRVRGLAMPHIELVDMKLEARLRRQGIHLISQRLEHLLKATVEAGRQAILLLNRRGYSNFVHCPSCGHVMQCKYCDVTQTYHRSAGVKAKGGSFAEGLHTGQLHCHYCLAVNPLPDKCPSCGKRLSLFGLGTQRVEEEIERKFPGLRFARVDSDTMRGLKDYESLLGRFAKGELQVLLGTQMIAKGLDYPNVTLVGVISGDTALSLPDFRAAERTFQLITQVAGRAGRGDAPGRVVLQTFMPDDPTIQAAIKQDYEAFAKRELQTRREVGLPPMSRMVRVILRDSDLDRLHERGEKLAAALAGAIAKEEAANPSATVPAAFASTQGAAVTMKGPMPCAINRIAGYHRAQMLLFSRSAGALQRVLAIAREQKAFAEGDRVAVDVDPVSLL